MLKVLFLVGEDEIHTNPEVKRLWEEVDLILFQEKKGDDLQVLKSPKIFGYTNQYGTAKKINGFWEVGMHLLAMFSKLYKPKEISNEPEHDGGEQA